MSKAEKYHRKRRKGARSHFYRYSKNKENYPPELATTSSSVVHHTEALDILPTHWKMTSDGASSQYCKVEQDGAGNLCAVTASVVINANSSWSVYIRGKKVPVTCKVLSRFPQRITSPDILPEIVRTVDHGSSLCPGNPDEKFVHLYRQELI